MPLVRPVTTSLCVPVAAFSVAPVLSKLLPSPKNLVALMMPEEAYIVMPVPTDDIPVTKRLSNVGESDIVIVAIPFGCGSADAMIFEPRKSS